jgi:H+-translocating NAD(P) transhydrogenase subunit alpha
MIFGVLKEPAFETRVSLLPDACATLIKKGHEVWVECSAGEKAFSQDDDYAKAGAKLASRSEVISSATLLLSIQLPDDTLLQGKTLLGVYQPLFHADKIRSWNGAGLTVFSLDMLPRTTRAQSMDVLSSQANIAGYKAVLTAATAYSRYFPMFMTAAGSIPPAKVLILGAGVAGLQAIATARRLGAVVEVFDTRPAVKEEVMSLGAKFVEVEGAADASKAGGYAVEQTEDYKSKQQQRIAESIAKADIVITTAQIPGKKAPILVTSEMMDAMRDGSVIVDLAAATGGNTPATKNNETTRYKGVTIIGNSNLAATMPSDASKLYGKNVLNFLQILFDKEGNYKVDFNDDLIKGACMAHEGKLHERIQ